MKVARSLRAGSLLRNSRVDSESTLMEIMSVMARKRAARRKQGARPVVANDLGPLQRDRRTPVLANHAEVIIEELPVYGRRARRVAMHDRLWQNHTITTVEHEAAERLVNAYELVDRTGMQSMLGRMQSQGGGQAGGPSDAVVNAALHIGRVKARLGPAAFSLLILACCEGLSVQTLALRQYGNDGGAARAKAEKEVIAQLRRLAGGKAHEPIDG